VVQRGLLATILFVVVLVLATSSHESGPPRFVGSLSDASCDDDAQRLVLLSFDDHAHLDDWVEIAPALEERGVVATFMLDRIGTYSESDWSKVQVLVAHGQQVGLHGEHHVGAVASGLSPEAWVEEEVLPGLLLLREREIEPHVLAMPRGDSTPEHEEAVLDVIPRIRLTWVAPRENVAPWSSTCDVGPVHAAVSLDESQGGVGKWLPLALEFRENTGGILHAYGHSTGGEGVDVDALLALVDGSSAAGWRWVGYDALDAEA
jgi:hypothetical protein